MSELKQLSYEQLESYNQEYINGILWDTVIDFIDNHFESGRFTFLDLGGGNGVFADRLLNHYPQSEAIVLDNAFNLIEINKEHARKKVILDSVENLEKYLTTYAVDIVFINWVLHHLVSKTYRKTRTNVMNTLTIIKHNKNVKYVSIFENMYNGIIFDNLPGRVIYQITSLKIASRLVHKMEANTAGIGVSFLSRKTWVKIFNTVFGCDRCRIVDYGFWKVPICRKLLLHIKNTHMSLFWIKNN